MKTRNIKVGSIVSRRRDRRSGYMLVATSLSLFFLMGVAGLAIDIGRMYITKAEAQAFADSAALNAATKLDGTSSGITNATSAATNDSDKWRFDTSKFTNVGVSFSTSPTGTFVSSPANPSGYNFVQVYVSANLPMYLIRVFSGPTATVAASAIAGQSSITSLNGGVFPFTPYSRATGYGTPEVGSGSDPFGYTAGHQYTLRWGAPGDRTDCPSSTDSSATVPLASQGKYRGYCCVSESAASLRQAIESLDTDSVTIGSTIARDNGAKNTEMSAIGYRVGLDSDTTSTTYSAYKSGGNGNGARVVVVPVNTGPQGEGTVNVAGLAAFFLLNSSYYSGLGGNDSACAEYIGPWTEGVPFPPQSTGSSYSSAYRLRLFK
jgi:Flp pilus assembly protein TadG